MEEIPTLESNPAIEEPLREFINRYDFIEGILVSAADGIPLMRVLKPTCTVPIREVECVYPINFSVAADYAVHMSFGELKTIINVNKQFTYMFVNGNYIVSTVIAKTGNEGLLLQLAPQIYSALIPLAQEIENP